MSCPICGAKCRCKKRGPGGICCGCHRHKAQRGRTRVQVDEWRTAHALEPISDEQWDRQFAKKFAQYPISLSPQDVRP